MQAIRDRRKRALEAAEPGAACGLGNAGQRLFDHGIRLAALPEIGAEGERDRQADIVADADIDAPLQLDRL